MADRYEEQLLKWATARLVERGEFACSPIAKADVEFYEGGALSDVTMEGASFEVTVTCSEGHLRTWTEFDFGEVVRGIVNA